MPRQPVVVVLDRAAIERVNRGPVQPVFRPDHVADRIVNELFATVFHAGDTNAPTGRIIAVREREPGARFP